MAVTIHTIDKLWYKLFSIICDCNKIDSGLKIINKCTQAFIQKIA